jgi:alpha-glucosidase
MDQYRDFTVDPKQFSLSDAKSFFAKLHNDSQHFVPIIDSAIYIPNPETEQEAYQVYNRGNASGAFIQNPDESEYIGAVWPGYTVFPDWLANSTVQWWIDEM